MWKLSLFNVLRDFLEEKIVIIFMNVKNMVLINFIFWIYGKWKLCVVVWKFY